MAPCSAIPHSSCADALLQGLAEALLTLDTPLRLTGSEASETSRKARLSPMGCSIMASVLSMSQVGRDALCRDMLVGCCCAEAWCPYGLQHCASMLAMLMRGRAAACRHACLWLLEGLGLHVGCSTIASVQLTTRVPAACVLDLLRSLPVSLCSGSKQLAGVCGSRCAAAASGSSHSGPHLLLHAQASTFWTPVHECTHSLLPLVRSNITGSGISAQYVSSAAGGMPTLHGHLPAPRRPLVPQLQEVCQPCTISQQDLPEHSLTSGDAYCRSTASISALPGDDLLGAL